MTTFISALKTSLNFGWGRRGTGTTDGWLSLRLMHLRNMDVLMSHFIREPLFPLYQKQGMRLETLLRRSRPAWNRPFSSLQQRTPSKFIIDQPRTLIFSILSSFVKSSSFICPFSFNYGSFAFMQEWWKINIKLPYGNRPVKKKQMRGNRSFWWEARATRDISICCYTAFPVFPTTENLSFCDLPVQLLFPGISLLLLIK